MTTWVVGPAPILCFSVALYPFSVPPFGGWSMNQPGYVAPPPPGVAIVGLHLVDVDDGVWGLDIEWAREMVGMIAVDGVNVLTLLADGVEVDPGWGANNYMNYQTHFTITVAGVKPAAAAVVVNPLPGCIHDNHGVPTVGGTFTAPIP
jgi:hypothetical protein